MPRVRYPRDIRLLQALLLLPAATLIAHGQVPQAPVSRLELKAELVLTTQFCATKIEKGSLIQGKETFDIGKVACSDIERALKTAFSSVRRVATDPWPGTTSAQVVLVPEFVDLAASRPLFSKRELIVLLEWTVKDPAGKPLWIETVQGSAKQQHFIEQGKRIIKDAVKDLAEKSAQKMLEAPELRKLR